MLRTFEIRDDNGCVIGEGAELANDAAVIQWACGGDVIHTTVGRLSRYGNVIYHESAFWRDLHADLRDPEFRRSFILQSVRNTLSALADGAAGDEASARESAYYQAIADYGTGRADGHAPESDDSAVDEAQRRTASPTVLPVIASGGHCGSACCKDVD